MFAHEAMAIAMKSAETKNKYVATVVDLITQAIQEGKFHIEVYVSMDERELIDILEMWLNLKGYGWKYNKYINKYTVYFHSSVGKD